MVEKFAVEKTAVEMSSPRLFNHELLNPMAQKIRVEKSRAILDSMLLSLVLYVNKIVEPTQIKNSNMGLVFLEKRAPCLRFMYKDKYKSQ